MTERLNTLQEEIQYWIDNVPDEPVNTKELFY